MHASKAAGSEEIRPSRAPVIVGIAALVASIGLVVVGNVVGFPTVLVVTPRIEPVLPQEAWLGWIGWVLTPLVVTLAYVWDSVSQRTRSADPEFSPNSTYPRVLRVVYILGGVVSIWHVLTIAVPIIEFVQGIA